ncbi:hypothetical protein ABTY59_32075 [Streptomyces sp. NPDC096079]|uniref:hypothetical protein n=1 Tax=Streptomyces sp. NPDC096079 TaxID=3155820 RepID=UPI0033233DFC
MTTVEEEEEPLSYEERRYGPDGPPEHMHHALRVFDQALTECDAYEDEFGDPLGALGLAFGLSTSAEADVMMGIGRALGRGNTWDEIAGALGMDVSEAKERWGGIGPLPPRDA